MTDISEEKRRLLQAYAKKFCNLYDASMCSNKPCGCALAAEYRAFVNKVIPEGYRHFTIRDFDGKTGEKDSLDSIVASRAKEKVFGYCWNDLKLLDRLSIISDDDLNKASIISDRLTNGNNVVIHGSSQKVIDNSGGTGQNTIREMPMGRTFIASILTNEALKMRLEPKHRSLNYEWVSFASLLKAVKDEDVESHYYEGCNWLVVDDITETRLRGTSASKAFIESLLDPFFTSRLKQKLTTVLVFKFDVHTLKAEIESSFGVAINKILNNKNTCTISLTENV